MAELKKGTYGDYYVGSLSSSQKETNVLYIYKYLICNIITFRW